MLIFTFLLLGSPLASCVEFQGGKVTGYIPSDLNGKLLLLVRLEGNVSGGCNTSGRFAIDSSLPRYKSILVALMGAYHAQTPVMIAYTQTCNAFGNSWGIDYVCIGNVPC